MKLYAYSTFYIILCGRRKVATATTTSRKSQQRLPLAKAKRKKVEWLSKLVRILRRYDLYILLEVLVNLNKIR